MKNFEKLQQIEDSLRNGQVKQYRDQVKRYGVKRFIVDYLDYCVEIGFSFPLTIKAYKKAIKALYPD